MHRIALLSLPLLVACGHAQRPAEPPDPTEAEGPAAAARAQPAPPASPRAPEQTSWVVQDLLGALDANTQDLGACLDALPKDAAQAVATLLLDRSGIAEAPRAEASVASGNLGRCLGERARTWTVIRPYGRTAALAQVSATREQAPSAAPASGMTRRTWRHGGWFVVADVADAPRQKGPPLESFPAGKAVVRCTITTEGRPVRCVPLEMPEGVDPDVILETISAMRIKPVLFQGKPVEVRYTFNINLKPSEH